MRGLEPSQQQLFSYINLEARIPVNPSLRTLKVLVDSILKGMDRQLVEHIEYTCCTGGLLGWIKTVGGMRKLKLIGQEKISEQFRFVAAIYNLVRIGSPWWVGGQVLTHRDNTPKIRQKCADNGKESGITENL